MTHSRASILVVDDDPDIRDSLALGLSDDGFDVTAVANGRDALSAARARSFDVVVTDLVMPGMDGVETCDRLKSLDPGVEVIVMTAYGSPEAAAQARGHGAYDYVRKPVSFDDLRAHLLHAVEKRHLQSAVGLYEASRVLLGTAQHEEIVRLAVELGPKVVRSSSILLALPGAEVHCTGRHRPADAFIERLARRAREERGPLLLSPDGERIPQTPSHEPYASALLYPLAGRHGDLGTLALLRGFALPPFSLAELHRAAVFANQVALALDNERLHRETLARVEELVATRDQLVQTEKLAVVGRFAGEVAHEINNPLAIVMAGLQSIRRREPELSGDAAEIVGECLAGAERIAQVVRSFTRMANPRGPEAAMRVMLGEAVEDCLSAWCVATGAPPSRFARCIDGTVDATISGEGLRTSVRHLLSFLFDSEGVRAPSPPVVVTVERADGRPSIALHAPGRRLSDEDREGLFDPRLRAGGPTGGVHLDLRLALAFQILHRYGSELAVELPASGGTAFRIMLPPGAD